MINDLLGKGLFPSQMPPCFTGANFSAFCVANTVPAIPKTFKKNTKSEKYSVARAGHFRRPTVIVNPHQYYFLAKEISDHQADITSFFSKSSISKSIPQFLPNKSRSISILPTRDLAELKLCTAPGYKYTLVTDIAQFFPSIYTHSLAWALYGKKAVKNALANPPSILPKLGDNLDVFTRHLNANQTIGLPIGPDSSHILAEIVGVAMDVLLTSQIPGLVGFRYVDDYTFYFSNFSDAENCLAAITGVLAEFELNINATKTRIVHISEVSVDYWTHELKAFNISNRAKKQKRDILHFFDVALAIAANNSDENVMKFALKKISARLIFKKNWKVFEANLLRVVLTHPNSIIDVAHILFTYAFHGYAIDNQSVGRTMYAVILEHAPLGHHSEVAWALWILAILKIDVPDNVSDAVCEMSSSPCIVLLLHLNRQGLCKKINNTVLVTSSTNDGPYGDLWLAVYEARVQGFYTPPTNPLASTFFETLEAANVRFFDFGRTPKPLFTLKPTGLASSWFDLHSESYPDEEVEFEDIPDDYADGFYDPDAENDEDESEEDENSDDSELDEDVEEEVPDFDGLL